MEQLYELDASAAQLRSLRDSATPAGGVRARAAALLPKLQFYSKDIYAAGADRGLYCS